MKRSRPSLRRRSRGSPGKCAIDVEAQIRSIEGQREIRPFMQREGFRRANHFFGKTSGTDIACRDAVVADSEFVAEVARRFLLHDREVASPLAGADPRLDGE